MRRLLTFATLAAISATLALAEDWAGKLIDTSCLDQKKPVETCQANGTTTSFALQVADKTYRLDDAGNHKWRAKMAWKTPKIVEVPVGMEINMYACAARK